MVKHLNKEEIRALAEAVRAHFLFHVNFCEKNPIGSYIQFPKIPKALSETIILDLIRDRVLLKEENISEAKFGGNTADILAKNASKELKIEVKGTGQKGFVQFGQKDITCDYLIWLHFNTFFLEKEDTPVEIHVLQNPSEHFKQVGKPGIDDFLETNPQKHDFLLKDFY
jgi:hypothetical protein